MSGSEEASAPTEEVWVVDRIEAKVVVLVLEAEDGTVVSEVAADLLGDRAVEGAVLRVPLGGVGEPVWERAIRDREAEKVRRAEAEAMLEELRKRDPGGDVSL